MPVAWVERFGMAVAPLAVAGFEQAFRGADHIDQAMVGMIMVQAGGAALLGAEGDGIALRQMTGLMLQLQADFAGQGQQGGFGGVAGDAPAVLTAAQAGVIGQQPGPREFAQVVSGVPLAELAVIALNAALRCIADALDAVMMCGGKYLLH